MPIKDHEHRFVEVHFMDQMYLTDEQKKLIGVKTSVDFYTAETCEKDGCTATRLDSSKKPLKEKPIVDVDAYKLSTTGSL